LNRIDLHVHTTGSDGTTTPEETVRLAVQRGLTSIAITDHDTTLAVEPAMAEGKRLGLEVIPGIEISTKYGRAVHILGYCYDIHAASLQNFLTWLVEDRDERNRGMCALLQKDGIDITYEQMKARFGEVIGRPHFGELLVENGRAASVQDAFTRLLNPRCPYYLPRTIISIDKAVSLIRDAGGIPVLAHPFQYQKNDAELRELIEVCMASGLWGMECRYSGYTAEQVAYLEALAGEYGLLKTGGSDFHGDHKPHIGLGTGIRHNLEVPQSYLDALLRAARY